MGVIWLVASALGLVAAAVILLAVGVSHGVRTMGYAKPGRWWFWGRGG